MATSYKLYLRDGDASKTLTESHPKLEGVTNDDFAALGEVLSDAYDKLLDEVTVQSETSVYKAA